MLNLSLVVISCVKLLVRDAVITLNVLEAWFVYVKTFLVVVNNRNCCAIHMK